MGFIGGICLPCYDLLVQVLPGTSPMKNQCEANLSTWKELSEERKKQKEAEQAEREKAQQEAADAEKEENSYTTDEESDPENEVGYLISRAFGRKFNIV